MHIRFDKAIMKHINCMNITLYRIFNHCERCHFLVGSSYFPIYIQMNVEITVTVSLSGRNELHYKNFLYKILFSNRRKEKEWKIVNI